MTTVREGMQCIRWKISNSRIRGTPAIREGMNTENITRAIVCSQQRKQIGKAYNADILEVNAVMPAVTRYMSWSD